MIHVRNRIRVEGDRIILRKDIDATPLMQHAKEQRQQNDKGFTPDRTMREVGVVAPSMLQADPLLKAGVAAQMHGDRDTADRCFKLFFQLNPEFRTSTGNI